MEHRVKLLLIKEKKKKRKRLLQNIKFMKDSSHFNCKD